MSTNTTTAPTAPAICTGCNKEFKGERGLRSHQQHRNALLSCKSDAKRAELSAPIEHDVKLAATTEGDAPPVDPPADPPVEVPPVDEAATPE